MTKNDLRKIVIVNTINDVPSNRQYFLLSQKLLEKGFEVIYITDNSKVIADYKGRIEYWKSKNFFKSFLFFVSIILKEKKFDSVILNFRATNFSFLFYFFSRKVIVISQSDFFPNNFFSKIKSSLKFLFAHEVVTISNYMKEKLVSKFYFIPKNKISVFHNSIEVKKFESSFSKPTVENFKLDFSTTKRLVFVGNLEYHKGFDLLMTSFIKYNSKKIQLKIIGDGQLKSIIPLNNENIIYLGRLSHQKVIEEMAQNHFIILPSRKEAFGQVIIEAMTVGAVPLIAKNIGASELIHNFQSGFLFDDVSEALDFIDKMSFEQYLKLNGNVTIHKNNFDSTHWVNQYYEFIANY